MGNGLLWTTEDAARLSSLRVEKGLDVFQVARLMNLSTHQVGELESLEVEIDRSYFYTPAIKAQIGHRLLSKLKL